MHFGAEKNTAPIRNTFAFSMNFTRIQAYNMLTGQYRQLNCSNSTEKLLCSVWSVERAYFIKSGSPPPASSIWTHKFLELEFDRHFEQHALEHCTRKLYIHRKFNAKNNWTVNHKRNDKRRTLSYLLPHSMFNVHCMRIAIAAVEFVQHFIILSFQMIIQ